MDPYIIVSSYTVHVNLPGRGKDTCLNYGALRATATILITDYAVKMFNF